MEPRARLGLDHTGPHPSLFLWSPLTRAIAGQLMVSQVPGTQGDRWGVPSVSGTQQAHTPAVSLLCRADPGASSMRGKEKTGRSTGTTWGDPTTIPRYGGGGHSGLRGQGACPRSQSKCAGIGNPSSSPPRAGSASEGLAPSPGSCEVTSSGVMGHKTQSPACLQWQRCQGVGLWLGGGKKGPCRL